MPGPDRQNAAQVGFDLTSPSSASIRWFVLSESFWAGCKSNWPSLLAHRPVQRGQVIEAKRRVGMFWPKNLLANPERFLVERFGFGVLTHRPVIAPRDY